MKPELINLNTAITLIYLIPRRNTQNYLPYSSYASFLLENGTGSGKGEVCLVFFWFACFFKENKSKTKSLQKTKAGQKLY